MSKNKDILPKPIPGFSLTQQTNQFPWDSPTLHTDLEEANNYANMKITEPDTLRYIQGFLEQGMSVRALGEIITKDLAFDGAFNFDVSELMKPLVTMQLIQIGAHSGIDVNLEEVSTVDQVELDLQNRKNIRTESNSLYKQKVKNIQDALDSDTKVQKDIKEEPVKGLMSKADSFVMQEEVSEDIEELIEETE